jgi:hypothetical protein
MVSVYMAKSGKENEKLPFANGDDFHGPTQYVDTLFQPEKNGKYRWWFYFRYFCPLTQARC